VQEVNDLKSRILQIDEDAQKRIADLKVGELLQHVEAMEEMMAEMEQKLSSHEGTSQSLERKVNLMNNSVLDLQQSVTCKMDQADVKKRIDDLESGFNQTLEEQYLSIAAFDEKCSMIEQAFTRSTDSVRKLQDSVTALDTHVVELQDSVTALDTRVTALDTRFNDALAAFEAHAGDASREASPAGTPVTPQATPKGSYWTCLACDEENHPERRICNNCGKASSFVRNLARPPSPSVRERIAAGSRSIRPSRAAGSSLTDSNRHNSRSSFRRMSSTPRTPPRGASASTPASEDPSQAARIKRLRTRLHSQR